MTFLTDPELLHWRKGNELFEKGEFEGAIACYDRALNANPDYSDARYNRGLAHHLLGHNHLALADLHWAMELGPTKADVWFLLGEIRAVLGEKSLAIENYRRALSIDRQLVAARVSIRLLEATDSEGKPQRDANTVPSLLRVSDSASRAPTPEDDEGSVRIPSVSEIIHVQSDETVVGAIERALHATPDDGESEHVVHRAVLLTALHRRGAADCWERLFRDSGSTRELVRAARAHYEFGEWDEVVRLMGNQLWTKSQELTRMRSHALLASGRTDEARDALLAVRGPTYETAMALAGTQLALGDSLSAETTLKRAIDMRTTGPRASSVLSIANRTWFSSRRPLDKLIGLDTAKAQIRERVVLPLLVPEAFLSSGGIGKFLMMGPPGCGKTTIARLAAREASADFRVLHLSSILNLYTGNSEANLSSVFVAAKDATMEGPVILFVDEVDSITVARDRLVQASEHRLLNHFMDELDQIRSFPKLMILAATNQPFQIDSAVIRSGRLGTPIYVGPPSAQECEALIENELKLSPHATVDSHALAGEFAWLSPADIEQVFSSLRYSRSARILSGDDSPITESEVREAFRRVSPSIRRWFSALSDRARQDPSLADLFTPDLWRDLEGYREYIKGQGRSEDTKTTMFG